MFKSSLVPGPRGLCLTTEIAIAIKHHKYALQTTHEFPSGLNQRLRRQLQQLFHAHFTFRMLLETGDRHAVSE